MDGLDPLLNAPKRLAILAVLSGSSSTDFTFMREHLQISDSDLSKQAASLEAADYLSISKSGRGRGALTVYKITKIGRAAYQKHRSALRTLLGS